MDKLKEICNQEKTINPICSCAGTSSTVEKTQRKKNNLNLPNDDEHPCIIKSTGNLSFQENGVGYEIFFSMRRYPNIVAEYFEETDEYQTFAEFYRDSISVAIKLREKGLTEDNIICLCVSNSRNSSLPFIAGLFVGCQINALDTSLEVSEITFLLKTVTPKIIFAHGLKIPDIKEALTQAEIDIEIVATDLDVTGYESIQEYLKASNLEVEKFRPYKVDTMKRTCIILFSSGSSGLPKGICLNHISILSQLIYALAFGYLDKTCLHFVSLYWISGVTFLLTCLLAGVSRVMPSKFSVNGAYKLIEKYKVDYVMLTPGQCLAMTENPKPQDIDTSSLKCIVTGGSALKETICYALRKLFPTCFVNQGYGMTEVAGTIARFCATNPREVALGDAKPSSCGIPFGGFWYKIVDENTGEILGPLQCGELCLKSDTCIMNGYYKKDSTDCFDEFGWLKTGDYVYYDEFQCFYVVDRVKELIKYRGWHVSPNIIENILITHPAVSSAVVIGIPHEEDGEHATALIVLNPEIDEHLINLEEIAEFANEQVSEKDRLRGGIKIIKTLPLSPTGKVRRRILKEAVLNGTEI